LAGHIEITVTPTAYCRYEDNGAERIESTSTIIFVEVLSILSFVTKIKERRTSKLINNVRAHCHIEKVFKKLVGGSGAEDDTREGSDGDCKGDCSGRQCWLVAGRNLF